MVGFWVRPRLNALYIIILFRNLRLIKLNYLFFQVAFSIDKILCVQGHFEFMKNGIYQLCIIAFIVIVNSGLYVEIPIGDLAAQINTTMMIIGDNQTSDVNVCDIDTVSFKGVLNIVNIIEAFILPFLLLLVGSLVIWKRSIRNSRANFKRTHYMMSENEIALNAASKRNVKYCRNCVWLNVSFVILMTPMALVNFLRLIGSFYLQEFYFISSLFPFLLNFSITFVVNVCVNSTFRKEFWQILK